MATAITYSTTGRSKDLRTVVVEDVQNTVVLLPAGRLDVVQAKLLHGTADRCSWWADQLGVPHTDDFVIPAASVVAQREMKIAVKIKTRKA